MNDDNVRIIGVWEPGHCTDDFEAYGFGVAINYDENYAYIGEAKKSMPNGKGIMVYYKSFKKKIIRKRYIGEFKNSRIITGKVEFEDGSSFEGSFDKNQNPYIGLGKFANGESHYGKWRVNNDQDVVPIDDDSFLTLLGGTTIAMVFVAATGIILVGAAAIAAASSSPELLLIVLIPK
ncbi:MAG: hypothetical protein PHS92_03140 [Candidatus Gracilibacteria bacterium]|nr:hypothetical protein [Candidatus Gracilibacteria bacterium]